MKPDGQWVLTVMKSRWRDLSPIQFSSNCNYSLITHNKTPVHSTWGLLRVCVSCLTPRRNLSSELRPSGNNILNTFPAGSTQDTTTRHVSLQLVVFGFVSAAWLYLLCMTLTSISFLMRIFTARNYRWLITLQAPKYVSVIMKYYTLSVIGGADKSLAPTRKETS